MWSGVTRCLLVTHLFHSACFRGSSRRLLFFRLNNTPLGPGHTLFIPLSGNRPSVCLHLLAVVSGAAWTGVWAHGTFWKGLPPCHPQLWSCLWGRVGSSTLGRRETVGEPHMGTGSGEGGRGHKPGSWLDPTNVPTSLRGALLFPVLPHESSHAGPGDVGNKRQKKNY